MNELTNQIQQIMLPKAALIAYEWKTNNYSRSQNYLELRPINEKGRMGAGIPVTYDFMNSLMESYSESMNGIPHGRVPKNMLWCDPRKGNESVCLEYSSLEKPQEMDFSGLQEYWEKRFWLSEFSHLGGSKNPTRSNLVSVTEQARNHPFDYSELQSSGKQLKDILS